MFHGNLRVARGSMKHSKSSWNDMEIITALILDILIFLGVYIDRHIIFVAFFIVIACFWFIYCVVDICCYSLIRLLFHLFDFLFKFLFIQLCCSLIQCHVHFLFRFGLNSRFYLVYFTQFILSKIMHWFILSLAIRFFIFFYLHSLINSSIHSYPRFIHYQLWSLNPAVNHLKEKLPGD